MPSRAYSVKDSPVVSLLRNVWLHARRNSWLTLNQGLADALSIAIRCDYQFAPDDFVTLALPARDGGFDATRWLGADGAHGIGERFYSMACGVGRGTANLSAAISYERWRDRKPFLIRQPGQKSRVRLACGVEFRWKDGCAWRVSSFSADSHFLNALLYRNADGSLANRNDDPDFARPRLRLSLEDVRAFNRSESA